MRGLWAALLALGLASGAVAQEFTTLKGHGGPIMAVSVGPDDRVASASFDNAVGRWDGRVPTWLDGHAAAVKSLAGLRDGTLISGGDDFTIRVWPDGGDGFVLGRHERMVADLAVSEAGGLLASASWDGTAALWRAPFQPQEPVVLRGHALGVNAVAFSPDGTRLYTGSTDGTIRVWDTATGAAVTILASHGFGVNRIVVTGDWLAYGAVDGGTRIIDPETGEEIADFTLDRRPILALAHDPGTQRLAVGDGEGYIMMIDTAEMRIAQDFRATRAGPIWALAFSSDGGTIWAGGIDDVIYGWPVAALGDFDPAAPAPRSFLRDAAAMPNGERQFMRKCSICHALEAGPSRKAGPSLHGVFGRRAGTVPGYAYSDTLTGSDIVWSDDTIDALFDEGPDHYIPGSKMPMQVIAAPSDRADLIAYLRSATTGE